MIQPNNRSLGVKQLNNRSLGVKQLNNRSLGVKQLNNRSLGVKQLNNRSLHQAKVLCSPRYIQCRSTRSYHLKMHRLYTVKPALRGHLKDKPKVVS